MKRATTPGPRQQVTPTAKLLGTPKLTSPSRFARAIRRALRAHPEWVAAFLLCPICLAAQDEPKPPAATQTPTPTQKQPETPKTAQQVKKVLPSYEGQNVSAVEIAGRPDVKTEDYASLFAQKAGEPFARAKVDET